jgi:hypothetical protein
MPMSGIVFLSVSESHMGTKLYQCVQTEHLSMSGASWITSWDIWGPTYSERSSQVLRVDGQDSIFLGPQWVELQKTGCPTWVGLSGSSPGLKVCEHGPLAALWGSKRKKLLRALKTKLLRVGCPSTSWGHVPPSSGLICRFGMADAID